MSARSKLNWEGEAPAETDIDTSARRARRDVGDDQGLEQNSVPHLPSLSERPS